MIYYAYNNGYKNKKSQTTLKYVIDIHRIGLALVYPEYLMYDQHHSLQKRVQNEHFKITVYFFKWAHFV